MTRTLSADLARPASFLDLLSLLFIGLKLTDEIDWSWWWVLAPFWVPFALAAFFFLVSVVVGRSSRRY